MCESPVHLYIAVHSSGVTGSVWCSAHQFHLTKCFMTQSHAGLPSRKFVISTADGGKGSCRSADGGLKALAGCVMSGVTTVFLTSSIIYL